MLDYINYCSASFFWLPYFTFVVVVTFIYHSSLVHKLYHLNFICFVLNVRENWSDFGCSLVHFTSDTTTCVCNHTTNFAILMKFTKDQVKSFFL